MLVVVQVIGRQFEIQELKFEIPKIYPITDTNISGISHAVQVEKLIAGGAAIVQLREKRLSAREFYDEAKLAVAVARESGVPVIINDRVDLAIALQADGVHLGQDDLPPQQARSILGPDAIIGFSTHTVEQAIAAAKMPVDYIAFGPIFGTTTKESPDPTVGLDLLSSVRKVVGNIPLVAIGGINAANVADVIAAGADAAAIISDIIYGGDIANKMRSLLTLTAAHD